MERLTRQPGWEGRLAAAIEAARGQPYRLGEHDCFRFACRVVEALTGVDLWPPFAGRYASQRQALKVIAEWGGTFTEAFTAFFGSAPQRMAWARRGDIAEVLDIEPPHLPHLGVVTGSQIAVLLDTGLAFLPRSRGRHCWRIG